MTNDRRRRAVSRLGALVVVSSLAVSGCTGSRPADDGAAASSSTTTTTTTGPTSSSSPSTGSSPPTTSVAPTAGDSDTSRRPAGGCADNGRLPPSGASDVTEVAADVDGDGRDDRVVGYRRADGVRRVGVELAAGGSAAVDASQAGLDGPVALRVLGGAALGGDGETVFAVTSAGASVVVVSLFQFVECSLASVRFASGETVALPVGGGITHGNGVACAGGELVASSAMSRDGQSFTTEDITYRVDGNTLHEVSKDRASLTRPGDAAALERYYTLDCPSLERGLAG